MSDDLTVLGPDGIRRSYDEHYDTMMDVKEDPTGAWQAIQKQAARIEELEAKLAEAVECFGPCITLLDGLVHESKREIEWGEEDAFRMGEWFENDDLERLESARNAIAELKGKTDGTV